MLMRRLLGSAALAFSLVLSGGPEAAEVELKIMHFLPPTAPAQKVLVEPWAKAVEEQSGGRITVQIFPAMQLGGKPPQLIDQVKDGIVDVVWALPGYTPGRFPKISVFELPFMVSDAVATTKAVQEYYEANAKDEFAEVHPIFFHVHARGLLHTKGKAIETVEDFQGMKLRAPSRSVGEALAAYGATPIFMPVPQMPEALSKNVIDGTVVPWEVTLPLRLYELTDYHTEIHGPRGLYTSVFLFAMNKEKYESLPDDLKAVIDANSGMAWSERLGEGWEAAEIPGREAAEKRGSSIAVMADAEVAELQSLAEPVYEAWVEELNGSGADGAALLQSARDLLDKYSAK